MPHAMRGMPCAAKVHILNAEVRRYQQLRAFAHSQNCAIVANATDDAAARSFCSKVADAVDELSFWLQAA